MSVYETLINPFPIHSPVASNGPVAEAEPVPSSEIQHMLNLEEALALTEGAPSLLRAADCDPGDEAIPRLTDAEGAEVDALERIINPANNLLPVAFLAEGVERQKAVARIALKRAHRGLPAGSGWGTGWLVADDLLMTNNHVLPTAAFAKTVRAEFNYQNKIDGSPENPDWYDLDPDSFFVTNEELDYTLVRVKCRSVFIPRLPLRLVTGANGEALFEFADEPVAVGVNGFTPPFGGDPDIPAANINPGSFTIPNGLQFFPPLCVKPGSRWGHLQLPTGRVLLRTGTHVNIIQHPQGRRKEIAVQQNRIDRIFGDVVRYTTDTEPGSSGSPVFNNAWDLLAIHHAGGDRQPDGTWINNEGIRMDRVVSDLRRQIPATSPVRDQLGI